MELSDNFARAFRINEFSIFQASESVTLSKTRVKGLKTAYIRHGDGNRIVVDIDAKKSDAEALRAIDAAAPAGWLARMIGADSDESSWHHLGLAERLRRAYVEPDLPQIKYEKPLKVAGQELFRAAAKLLNYNGPSLTVRRALSSAIYSPVVGEGDFVMPTTGRTRRVQFVADPSPLSDKGWCLRVNAYGLNALEVDALHEEFPAAIKELQSLGYDMAPLPWIGQGY